MNNAENGIGSELHVKTNTHINKGTRRHKEDTKK